MAEPAANNEPKPQANDPVESPDGNAAANAAGEPNAGAAENAPDYGMVLEAVKRMEDNQARMAGQIAKLIDAQSVLVDAGAVIHDPAPANEPPTGVDEFIPIEKLDLSI